MDELYYIAVRINGYGTETTDTYENCWAWYRRMVERLTDLPDRDFIQGPQLVELTQFCHVTG